MVVELLCEYSHYIAYLHPSYETGCYKVANMHSHALSLIQVIRRNFFNHFFSGMKPGDHLLGRERIPGYICEKMKILP